MFRKLAALCAMALIAVACGDDAVEPAGSPGSPNASATSACSGPALFSFTADNFFELYLNGTTPADFLFDGPHKNPPGSVLQPWKFVDEYTLDDLTSGDEIFVRVENETLAAGLNGYIDWTPNGNHLVFSTGSQWELTTDDPPVQGTIWSAVTVIGAAPSAKPWEGLNAELNALGAQYADYGVASWIWDQSAQNHEVLWFKFVVPNCDAPPVDCSGDARFMFTADNSFEIYLNGAATPFLTGPNINWKNATVASVILTAGDVVDVHATNETGQAGLLGRIEWFPSGGQPVTFVTDGSWTISPGSSLSQTAYGSGVWGTDVVAFDSNFTGSWLWDAVTTDYQQLWFQFRVPDCESDGSRLPDLTVQTWSFSGDGSLQVVVCNKGEGPAAASTLALAPSGQLAAVPAIPQDDCVTVMIEGVCGGGIATISVDVGLVVAESDETNNSQEIDVPGCPGPDLTIQSWHFDAGGALVVEVCNLGDAQAPATVVTVENVVDANGSPFTPSVAVGPLDTGDCVLVSLGVAYAGAGGIPTVWVDQAAVISETDETNNSAGIDLPPPPCARIPRPPILAGWWPFDRDERLLDLTGGPDGVPVGSHGFAPGMVREALDLDGSFYVDIPDHDQIDINDLDFTIDFWMRSESSGSSVQVILDKRGSEQGPGYHVYLYQGRIGLQLADGTSFTNYNAPGSSPVLTDGDWHFVAITVDRDGVGTFYVDAAVVGTFVPSAFDGADLGNGVPLRVGASTAGSSSAYVGLLDELEIFRRQLLTAGEIRAIFSAGDAGKCRIR